MVYITNLTRFKLINFITGVPARRNSLSASSQGRLDSEELQGAGYVGRGAAHLQGIPAQQVRSAATRV